jgi:hypothetical protein
MKERDFLNWVVEVARLHSWSVWHVPAPMKAGREGKWVPAREAAGLPDLILMHDDPPSLIFAELKGETGKLSEAQRDFLQMARHVSEYSGSSPNRRMNTYVWKPGLEEFIETILKTRVLS